MCSTNTAGWVNRLVWMQRAYALTDADVVLQKTPYSFDVSVWEFFWPLMTGACIAVAEPGGRRDVAYLRRAIDHFGVTTLHFVPSMLHGLPGKRALGSRPRDAAHLQRRGGALGRRAVMTYRERFRRPACTTCMVRLRRLLTSPRTIAPRYRPRTFPSARRSTICVSTSLTL